ncbi:MAG TPA: cyclopropane-fatty-acyl-phospholipid synthase family protein [Vicinamibacterales bacterium]|nr:cyclopropane-fatty-acyl-phospholipid synthase family protein [Vicinamibacterales bacterium]
MIARTTAATATWATPQAPGSYAVRFASGTEERVGDGPPAFTIVARDRSHLQWFLNTDPYSAAMAFIRDEVDVTGDLVAAVRFFQSQTRRTWRAVLYAVAARLAPHRIEGWFQTPARAARNIRFHYDRSNAFYQQFLDTRLVYSCAYFSTPETSLDAAQAAKLDLICRKLDLRPSERFLDIGSGWGGLVMHAAQRYGAEATGCTLSRAQAEYAHQLARRAAAAKMTFYETDFRDLEGKFDKIASVGMFEHMGRRRLRNYFRKIFDLLEADGLFLNHGIVRPQPVTDGPQTLFLQRRVFPGGELPHLSDVLRSAELAGFEALDVEDLRPHYALTCRAWVERLQRNAAGCLEEVDRTTYRTWLLYLAGSAASFETGQTDVAQILFGKRDAPRRRLTRSHMLGEPANA